MPIHAIFKVHLEPTDKDSYYRSMVKIDLEAGPVDIKSRPVDTSRYRKFLESKVNYTTLETNIKQNLRHKKNKEKKTTNSAPQNFSFLKSLIGLEKKQSNTETKREIDFFKLKDTSNNACHHVKIVSPFLYIIVTNEAERTKKNTEIFLKIEEIEENFSDFKANKREKTEEALKNFITLANKNEAKEKKYSSSSTKADYSFFHLCCHCESDEAPSHYSYKRLK